MHRRLRGRVLGNVDPGSDAGSGVDMVNWRTPAGGEEDAGTDDTADAGTSGEEDSGAAEGDDPEGDAGSRGAHDDDDGPATSEGGFGCHVARRGERGPLSLALMGALFVAAGARHRRRAVI